MYEYVLRLARDCPGLKGIQGQAKCLLAAINSLRLVEAKFAWVTRPVMAADADDDDADDDVGDGNNDVDDDMEFGASPPKRPRPFSAADSVSCSLMYLWREY